MTASRVLVIDDDPAARRLLTRVLAEAGHVVMEAENGEAGLALVRTEPPPDLVVTDILMPRKDGLEMIREIIAECPDARIIAISGGGSTGKLGHLDVAEHLGAVATLSKPFLPEDLLRVVSMALED